MNLPNLHVFQGPNGVHGPLINGVPAGLWFAMSDERRATYMREKRKTEAYKTEMCKMFIRTGGNCSYGVLCRFAHDENELRLRPVHPKYKTELCRNYSNSLFCPYGQRCQFIHRSPPSRRLGGQWPPEDDRLAMMDAFPPSVPSLAFLDDDPLLTLAQPSQYSKSMGPTNGFNSLLPKVDDEALPGLDDYFAIWQPLSNSGAGMRIPSSSSGSASGGSTTNDNKNGSSDDTAPSAVKKTFGLGGNFSRSCFPALNSVPDKTTTKEED